MIQKLSEKDYAVSKWSGGTTTQLAIWPPEAKYAERDFLWRVSTAAVDLEESDFTPLPDYDRLIAPLEGEIVLTHNGGAPLTLRPFEVHAFSGADATHSRGRCRDFNLMLRRGRATGAMETLRLSEIPTNLHAGTGIACPPTPAQNAGTSIACPPPPAREQVILYCVEGAACVDASPPLSLAPGEALLLTDPAPLTLTGPAVLMLCRMTLTPQDGSGPSNEQKRGNEP